MLHFPNAAILPSHAAELEAELVLERICVRRPYFALEELRLENGVLTAAASADSPSTREAGPMQAGEISRHAAIAGLCAAAMNQSDRERRYYLAREARYQGFENAAPYGARVAFQAELLEFSKREVLARIVASTHDAPLAALEVRYTVLTEAAFERLFKTRRQPTPVAREMGALPPGRVEGVGSVRVRHIERVPAEVCAGHFEHYPALPVAVLMGQLVGLAGGASEAGSSYRVARGTVEAWDLCWAGERVRLGVEPAADAVGEEVLECTAQAEERPAARMRLTLDRLGSLA